MLGWTGRSIRASVTDMYGIVVKTLFDVAIPESPYTLYTLNGLEAADAYGVRGDGMYLLVTEVYVPATEEVLEVSAVQFALPSVSIEIDAIDWDLRKPIVYYTDQTSGGRHNFQAPLTTLRIPSGYRFSSSIYDLKIEKQLGRMVLFYGGQIEALDSGWVRRSIMHFDYDFTDLDSMAVWVANQALKNTDEKDDVIAIVQHPDITTERKIQMLLPYATRQMEIDMQARVVDFAFLTSASPPRASFDMYFDVGFLNIDLGKVVAYACIGAAVAGAIAITAGTFGLGAPIGASMVVGALAGAGIAFATSAPASEPPSPAEADAVREKVDQATETLDTLTSEAEDVVREEEAAGRVDPAAATRIITSIDKVRAEVSSALDEVQQAAVEAVEAARNRGRLEGGLIGGVAGALGGGVVGYFVGRRR